MWNGVLDCIFQSKYCKDYASNTMDSTKNAALPQELDVTFVKIVLFLPIHCKSVFPALGPLPFQDNCDLGPTAKWSNRQSTGCQSTTLQ